MKNPYSIQAFHQLISIAFNKLNLINLRSVYISEHKSTKKMNAIFGFEAAGSLKKFFFNGEKYVDINIEQLSQTNKLWNDNKLINWINSKN